MDCADTTRRRLMRDCILTLNTARGTAIVNFSCFCAIIQAFFITSRAFVLVLFQSCDHADFFGNILGVSLQLPQ